MGYHKEETAQRHAVPRKMTPLLGVELLYRSASFRLSSAPPTYPLLQTPPAIYSTITNDKNGMDVVGTGASILAFINLSAQICITATKLTQQFRDAPEELLHLSKQLRLLHSELIFIKNFQQDSDDDNLMLLPDEEKTLSTALSDTKEVFGHVQRACKKFAQKGKITTWERLVWIIHEQSKTKDIISRLEHVKTSLHTILLLINIRITNLSRKAIESQSPLAITAIAALIQEPAVIRRHVESVSQQGISPTNVVLDSLATRDPHDKNEFWGSRAFLEDSWIRLLGLQAVMSWYGNDYQSTYDFSGRYKVNPIIAALGVKLICLDFRLRRFPLAGFGLSFVSGGFTIKNVVPEDSTIMAACKKGDVVAVRELFRTGRASPNDVTPENSSPLRYAIENGSKELVEYLLLSGTDVDSPFGKFMTSPLEWAFASRKIEIARLFFQRGAKVDHISAKGWTPAFDLFGYEWIHHSKESCNEYLELLSAASFSEINNQDVDGWSAMHRAAAFGSREDITALIKYGSSCTLLTNMNWTPIRCAVRFENEDTFLELAKHLQPSFVDDQDIRGWTLLHEAADMGSYEMLHLVLQYKPDPYAVTKATACLVPDGMENCSVTAAQIARNAGDEAYQTYVDALREFGIDLMFNEEDDTDDMFWPANMVPET